MSEDRAAEAKARRELYMEEVLAAFAERRDKVSPIMRFGRLTGIRIDAYNPRKPGDAKGRSTIAQSGD